MRADHAGFLGYDRPTTPFLDSLAAESLVFPVAIVAGAPTYYSFPAIMASRFPLAMGRDVVGIAPQEPTIASAFEQAGYATAAFSAGNPYISLQFGYHQGFDVFRDFLGIEDGAPAPSVSAPTAGWARALNRRLQEIRPRMGPLRPVYDEAYFQYCQRWAMPPAKSLDLLRRFPAADVIVDQARAWLASIGQGPFFLWLHLMDPHAPYYPTSQALELMESGAISPARARYLNSFWIRSDLQSPRLRRHRDEVMALYDAGICWVDAQMSRLVETLRRFRLWDNCIFALTADHGEEFLEHEGRFHPPSNLREEMIHVPLLLRVPGVAKHEPGESPFSLVHLGPTLLSAAQIPIPSSFQGEIYDLRTPPTASKDSVAITEVVAGVTNPFQHDSRIGPRVLAVRERRFKLLLRFDPPTDFLYDLEADPLERAPLAATAAKPMRRRLLEIARDHVRRSPNERDRKARVLSRLRDLRLEWAKTSNRASPVMP